MSRSRLALTVSSAILLLAALLSFDSAAQLADQPVVIEVKAKKYEFNPEEITVKKGSRVRLKVTATDRKHGMEFKVFPEGAGEKGPEGLVFAENVNDYKLEKGKERIIEFVALRAGTYEIKCSVMCGLRHRWMKGKLMVTE